jgi:hypothetical protein
VEQPDEERDHQPADHLHQVDVQTGTGKASEGPLNEAPHLILQQPNQLLRESHEARRFHTTWVISDRFCRSHTIVHVRFAPKATVAGLMHRSKRRTRIVMVYSITSSAL